MMKNLVIMLAIGAFFFGLFLSASPVKAAPAFEDPQLCVNGKLLRVDPTTSPIDVFVQVGANLTVDYNVESCGGDPNFPVLDSSQVSVGGRSNELEVRVQTDPKARAMVTFDGKSKLYKADKQGWIEADFKVK
jgi:hypothetical protein